MKKGEKARVPSETQVKGQVMSQVVRRLMASGLSKSAMEEAISAAKGEVPATRELKLTKKVRSQIMAYVHENGPIVMTGRKSLKVFSLESYRSMQAKMKVSATSRKLWLTGDKSKTSAVEGQVPA